MQDSLYNKHLINSLTQSENIMFFSITDQLTLINHSKLFAQEFEVKDPIPPQQRMELHQIPEFNKLNPDFINEISNCFKQNQAVKNSLLISANKNIYKIEIQAVKTEDGKIGSLICIGSTIPIDKSIENSAESLNPDFSHLLESAGDGILVGDEKGHIINLNKKIAEFTGYHFLSSTIV